MEDGIIQEEGTPDEIFSTNNTRVKDFIGKFVG
jgi:polar amino acid transport system ATP-binding protein